jgi:hypothetical protein
MPDGTRALRLSALDRVGGNGGDGLLFVLGRLPSRDGRAWIPFRDSSMSPNGTKLPSGDVREMIAIEGKTDVQRAIVNRRD